LKPPSQPRYQVAVIGAGPAGTTCATLLAKQGHQVILFEKEQFPRHHVGESLMTETYGTFERLGMLDFLRSSNYVRKQSVQFFSQSGRPSAPFYFEETNPHESATTWQLPRPEFDQLMMQNAARNGVEVCPGTKVDDVLIEADQVIGVEITGPAGTRQIKADVVVDASGLSALIGRKLKLLQYDSNLKKASIYGHFQGAARDSGRDQGATLIINMADDQGWFWYIPLANDIVSVGAVGDKNLLLAKGSTRDLHESFMELVRDCQPVRERLQSATLAGEMHACSDFSYASRRIAGNGYVLIGDAFGFLDPVYSSGLFLALKSGEMAAETIAEAIAKGDYSSEQLSRWGENYVRGMSSLRKLVYCFYSKEFKFSSFLKQHPQFKTHLVDLLTGNIFRPGINEIFEAMEDRLDLPGPYRLES
jgi:flavin-dependent dehydrogenase